ncbi:MAG: VOC family protein [Betaproteobacteria bacterium]
MQVQPYLFFNGKAEEAIAFYQRALGADHVNIMRYKDSPEPPPPGMVPPGSGNKVMHASFRVGATEILASDGNITGKTHFDGFSLAISADDDAHAKRYFDALADGGQVTMPLGKTFFSSSFGMLSDRFGVHWMVMTKT